MDAFTDLKFLVGLAEVCRLGTPIEKTNFLTFDLGNIFLTRDVSKFFKSADITNPSYREENIVVKRLIVQNAALSRLRKKCIESGDLSFRPSRVEL